MNYTTIVTQNLADTVTPVSVFSLFRNTYTPCLLLESSDYHTKEDSYSLVCFDQLEDFELTEIDSEAPQKLSAFIQQVRCDTTSNIAKRFNSVFGFTSFEAVQCFEKIRFSSKESLSLSLLRYGFFRFLLVFEHFSEQYYLIENIPEGQTAKSDEIINQIENNRSVYKKDFKRKSQRKTNISDQKFKENVSQCKEYCQQGEVFQIVVSRRFEQAYQGDNFLVYRSLRSINPSPFSFYFDYGEFQIFGASPEAQLLIRNQIAEIHPIAGTFKRTGDDQQDAKEAERLFADPKENSEHIMLVDLARNDLGRNTLDVTVDRYREIQFYSHVIHLVSKVIGRLTDDTNTKQVFADTFPAGTLSGAPKYRALQLIDGLETTTRGIYGGAIGAFGLNGDVNHAIGIRTFFAKDNHLYYQAGAGVVIDSDEELENQEVYHKLKALEAAMEKAEQISES